MVNSKNHDISPPQDFESLRSYILERRDELPKRLTQVAEFALQYPDEIAFGTTKSIAEEARVQPSTIVRLANQLGYNGFSAFQNVFRERLRNRPISYAERLSTLESRVVEGSEEAIMVNGFLTAARESMNKLEASIDLVTLKKAVEVLSEAENIYLLAKRRAYPLVSHMAYTFGKLKIRYQSVGSPIGNDNDILETATTKDAVIAISFSPYAQETITQIQMMANNRVPSVVITDSPFSPLVTGISPIWFEIVEADYAGFRSLSASFILTSTLAVAIAQHRQRRRISVSEGTDLPRHTGQNING